MLLTAFCRQVILPALNRPNAGYRWLNHLRDSGSGEAIKRHYVSNQTLRIMQLTGILLLAFSLSLSARTVSQTVTLSVKNATLEEVFTEIERQTGFIVGYNAGLLHNAKPVTIDVSNLPLKDFLDQLLQGQRFSYFIRSKTVFVTAEGDRKSSTRNITEWLTDAPPVTGKITDAQGRPIVGANIIVRGSEKGTTS